MTTQIALVEASPALGSAPADDESRAHKAEFLESLRFLEALIFAAPEPLSDAALKAQLAEPDSLPQLLEALQDHYRLRGVQLVKTASGWRFQTALDLAPRLQQFRVSYRKLSQTARETLAIIAYHQPVTRAEIDAMRGAPVSNSVLSTLLNCHWILPAGHRNLPGRPLTWRTTKQFLDDFGLRSLDMLPGIEALRASGLVKDEIPTLSMSALDVHGEHNSTHGRQEPSLFDNSDESNEFENSGNLGNLGNFADLGDADDADDSDDADESTS